MNTRMLRCKVQGMKLRAIRLIGVQSMVGQQVRERRRRLGRRQVHTHRCIPRRCRMSRPYLRWR